MSDPDHPDRDHRLDQLEDEAAHARRRYELYKAKVHGPKRASPVRLRELQRESEFAAARLSRSQGAVRAAEKDDTYEHDMIADDLRIEAELRKDANRTDTRVARAAHTPFTAVRAVRERLGLYLNRR